MSDDLTAGLGLDPDEMQRRARLQGQLGMSNSATGPQIPPDQPPQPRIPAPSAGEKTPPVTLRGVLPQTQDRTAADEAEAKRIQSTGSGISQIQHGSPDGGIGIAKPHRILGGFLRGVETLGNIVAPWATAAIPGTELHHQVLLGQQRGRIGQDIEEQGKEVTAAHTAAEIPALENPPIKDSFELWQKQHPSDDVSKFFEMQQEAKPPNEMDKPLANAPQLNQALARRFQVLNPGKPLPPEYTLPTNATNGDYARINESLKNEEGARGTAQTHADSQATTAEARKQRQSDFEISRNDRLAHQEQERTDKLSKPTADEQRRADLSENLNENLGALEEIVNRRPDLFGPMAGRITGLRAMVGTSDNDIAALETIKHQIGMAQISAHGMRSAQGIGQAADSILNSFHNSPEAVKAAINAARTSVGTFTKDVENKGQGGGQGAELKPPKAADAGMKWQHRTANGQVEWRQVPQ